MTKIGKIVAAGALAGILAVSASCAQPRRFTAKRAAPATIPLLLPPGTAAVADATRYIDIIVDNFRPSPTGPVQIVVDAVTSHGQTEIGRFAIYPERAFVTNERAEPQRFGLAVPPGLRLDRSTRLIVRIVPSRGDGTGAAIEVEPARFRPR
jgi:hypothetical protein